jgi:hypothetical protein
MNAFELLSYMCENGYGMLCRFQVLNQIIELFELCNSDFLTINA